MRDNFPIAIYSLFWTIFPKTESDVIAIELWNLQTEEEFLSNIDRISFKKFKLSESFGKIYWFLLLDLL